MRRVFVALFVLAMCFSSAGGSSQAESVVEHLRRMEEDYLALEGAHGTCGANVYESREIALFTLKEYTKENILAVGEIFPELNLYMLTKAQQIDMGKYMKDAWGIDEEWFISPDETQTIEANNTVIEYLDQIGPSKHGGYIWIQMRPEKEVLVVQLLDEDETINDMLINNPNIRIVFIHADHSLGELEETRAELLDRAKEFGITDVSINLYGNIISVHTSRYTVENIHAIREAFPEFDRYQILDEEGLL